MIGSMYLGVLMAAITMLLPPCPNTPNCVSTMATDAHAIAPMHYTSTREEAMKRLLGILRALPRTTIVASDDHTIRAEFRTAVFRFVDDGTFLFDEATKTIHFRSASRVGRSDFGVNRRRMESIRQQFDGKPVSRGGAEARRRE
jgi:uncharacterized protein (DUF1499 family)